LTYGSGRLEIPPKETAMANRKNFTPAEWTKVLESVMLAGMAVSAADPSGLWGTLQEALASRSALAASKRDPASNELVKAAIAELETSEGRSAVLEALRKHIVIDGSEPPEIVKRSLSSLRDISTILDTKAPDDAAGFKAFLRDIGQRVAEASLEGGFLGFGGTRVSSAEKATLADIAKALGTNA
jgi:hypothetical protein